MAVDDADEVAIWPVFGITIRTPSIELRPMRPGDWFAMAELAARGVHDPATMPFAVPWTDVEPPQLQRNTVQHYALTLATFTPAAWTLAFVVHRDGELVGTQDVMTAGFATTRSFTTGSWLGIDHQGRGIGTEMRAAVLQFMFEAIGALDATTGAWSDNLASQGVTRKIGYRENGSQIAVRRGERVEQLMYRLSRDDWTPSRRHDIEITGVTDAVLDQLGLLPDA